MGEEGGRRGRGGRSSGLVLPPARDLLCRSRRRRRAARYSEAGSTPSSSRRWAAQRVREGCRRRGRGADRQKEETESKRGDPPWGAAATPFPP